MNIFQYYRPICLFLSRSTPSFFLPFVFALLIVSGLTLGSERAFAEIILHRGSEAEPETLDPQKSSTLVEANIIRDLFEGLVILDATGEIKPGIAESWQMSPDGRVYTFKLRPDSLWSNGDKVRAADFVFSLQRLVDPKVAAEYANVLYPVRNAEAVNTGKLPASELGVRALDALTVEIILQEPTPYFLELLAHQITAPVHPPSVTSLGDNFVKPGQMISNGAYVLSELIPGSHIRLRKNPRYHSASTVKIDVVDYILVKDLAAGVRRFKAGELDLLPDVPTDQMTSLRQTFGERLLVSALQGTIYFAFNTRKAPFSDPRVRQALAMAIDRDFLAEDIANGALLPALSFVPPGTALVGAQPAEPPWQKFSIIEREERAIALLKEAGFSRQKPLSLEFRYNISDNNKAMAVAVADMWKRIGVETRFIATDSRTHFAYLRDKGDFDVARAGWVADYNDPQNFLFLLESDNPLNFMRWAHGDFDLLMRGAGAEIDPTKRAQLLRQAEELMLAQTPLTSIAYYTSRVLISEKLTGFVPNLRSAHATRFLALDR